ncbi:MAG TPA: helix-hairpin-helix domain-containing protein, partial [Anaerolineales bacterium]|nr:helix-hairpin-helix domain-containing protein [Anaerolineales bacterium]
RPAQPLPEGKLPEWMQEAGWTEGSEEGDEIGGFSSGDEIDQQEEALAAEDMPDWLQAIAPEEDLPEPDFLEEQSDVDDAVSPGPNPTGSLPWIEETPSSDSDSVAVWLQDKEVPLTGELKADQIGEPVELPEWLQGMEDEASQPSFGIGAEEASLGEKQPEAHQELDARESELPESPVVGAVEPPALDGEDALAWLENLAEKQGISDGLLLSPEDRREDLPDWAQEIPDEIGEGEPIIPASEVSPAVQAEQGGLPDWLGGSEEFNQGGIPTVSEQKHEGEAEPAEELPEWLSVPEEQRVIEPEEVSSTVVEQVTDGSLTPEEEAAFAWLEGLAEKQGAEEALLSRPEDRPEETPQWVQEAVSQADEHSVDQDGGVISPEAEIIAPESEAEEISTASMTDEWLLEDEVDEALGERLQESAPIHGEVSESEERDLPVETSEIADMEVADLPAWLRESDMEQPEMQVQPSEEADSRLPDWLQPDYEESISESSQTEDLPAWLKQTQTVSEPEQIEEPDEVETAQAIESKPAEEMFEFDMLFSPVEIQEPAITGETEDHLSIEEPAIIEGDTAPVGIHKEGPEPAIEESMLVDEGEGIPDWLEGLEVEEAVSDQAILDEKLPGEPALEATDEETAYAWLEGLAAKQGADEALLLQPEERFEEPPDWVIQASEEAEITASVPQSGEAPVAEEAMSEEIEYEEQRLAEYSELPMVDEADILTPAAETTLSFEEEITEAIETDTFEQLQGEKSVPELPDWLEGLDQEAELREETTWQPPEVTPIQELPTQAEELATEKPLVNVNEAGLVQLEQLPGIGFIKAQAILEFREQHGDFKNLDDLLNVPGLGPGIVNEIRNMITIGAHPEPEALESLSEHQITLMQARNAFVSGELEHTVALYQKLIKAEQMLPEVINDLNEALYRFPVDISIWEALGDAYFRADKLQSALDAYTKAEELLR